MTEADRTVPKPKNASIGSQNQLDEPHFLIIHPHVSHCPLGTRNLTFHNTIYNLSPYKQRTVRTETKEALN